MKKHGERIEIVEDYGAYGCYVDCRAPEERGDAPWDERWLGPEDRITPVLISHWKRFGMIGG